MKNRIKHSSVNYITPGFYRSLLATLIGGAVSGVCLPAHARDVFDAGMLQAGLPAGQIVDLSRFENSGEQLPGEYMVDIYVNDVFFASRRLSFVKGKSSALEPQLTAGLLGDMGVNLDSVPSLHSAKPEHVLTTLNTDIPDALAKFDFEQQRLNISIPQVNMKPDAGELADQSLWDAGIPAMILNYNLTGSNTRTTGSGGSSSLFGSLSPGINLGVWRLRSQMSWSVSRQSHGTGEDKSQSDFSVWNTYLQRDTPDLKGELTMGESMTRADVLDGFPMRGVKLETNDEMYPDSQRGFAPVVSGIARTHAQVTVTQNGIMIYQTNVSPGAFKLTNLNQAGTAGDLVVTVRESDGSEHTQRVAYTSLPIMQRAGHLEYSLAAGQYHQSGTGSRGGQTPLFATGTLIYGLPHDVTVYGGLLGAENYQSGVAGAGISLGEFGAFSADITLMRAKLKNTQNDDTRTSSGESYRVKYSKSMTTTGTTMNLAAYRYSTKGYYSFSDVNDFGRRDDDASAWAGRKRNSWQVMLSQSLGSWGSVYLSGQRDEYWGNHEPDDRLTAGYNSTYKGVSYGVNYSQDLYSGADSGYHQSINRMVSLNVNVPLRVLMGGNQGVNAYMTYNGSLDNSHQNVNSLGFGGTALEDGALSYNVGESWGNKGQVASTSVSGAYQGSAAQVQGSYNADRDQQTLSYGINGGVLVHPYGVTLSRMMYDSMALVRAPGASGVKLMNATNIRTNGYGYAVQPSLTNYRQNTLMLDPSDMPDNAEVTEAGKRVYPTRGAVVLADYNVLLGQQILMTLRYLGKPIPFGAMASLAGTERGRNVTGIVDEGGKVYLAGMPASGKLDVSWGKGSDQHCVVNFTLPAPAAQIKGQVMPLRTLSGNCR